MEIVKKGDKEDEFLIRSHSNENLWYKVNIKEGSCTCPHYYIRLKNTTQTCKHYKDLMEYLSVTLKDKEPLFKEIEVKIRQHNNYIDWLDISDKYGDDIIEEMIRLNKLIELRKGFLSVLE